MHAARAFFDQLNADYLVVHRAKEDLFWTTYMGTSEDHPGFARAEQAYKEFISSPDRLAAVEAHLAEVEAAPASAERDRLRRGLAGWRALFACHAVTDETARALGHELIEAESALFAQLQKRTMTHQVEGGRREDATLSSLATNMRTNPDPDARASSHQAMLELERWVLGHGLLDLVRLRNRLARALGHADFFAYKVQKNEQMTVAELFAILDDFEARTHGATFRTLRDLASRHGDAAVTGPNLRYVTAGDVTRDMDPFLPFGQGLRRWVHSFRRLGITYRGAVLQLDLLDRKGKYQNGFCHGPVPSFRAGDGRWVPAQVNFTADAKPDQVGSGARALDTLFHEGGHAAHFANVTEDAPCFSQEYPPTSMAYAETQSMFCDSLLGDADWLVRYARDASGAPPSRALLRRRLEATQPMRAFDERGMLVVAYFERDLYALADAELTPERVLALARATEQRVLGVSPAPRPLLAIPHLLNQESAASYHGYLLAHMAVYQTRAYFLREHGYLTDNPAIGPALAQHYWAAGNAVSHQDTVRALTGQPFTGAALAEAANQSVDEAWAEAERLMAAAAARAYPPAYPDSLDATIRVVHGAELIADSSAGEDTMCAQFEAYVARAYPTTAPSPAA